MLGIRPETENAHLNLRNQKNQTTSRFTSKLIDRFHTSGISGSMEKHKSELLKAKESNQDDNKHPPILSRREREIKEDSDRLAALEAQLTEVAKAYYENGLFLSNLISIDQK